MTALSKLFLPQLCNQKFDYFGIDCLDLCLDKQLFTQWPHVIDYGYNSRGFRDNEWPQELGSDTIWCLGDSFTVGLGSCFSHTWPQTLSRHSQHRVVNISMDGASNQWIARNVCDVYDLARPDNIVIMWSYLHRREKHNFDSSDLKRRQHYVKSTVAEDYANFNDCRKLVQMYCADSNLIEFAIPDFEPCFDNSNWQNIRDASWPELLPPSLDEFLKLDPMIIIELQNLHNVDLDLLFLQYTLPPEILTGVIKIKWLDRARDGHHFDIITADWVAKQALTRLRL
jgi:hypothetical protein